MNWYVNDVLGTDDLSHGTGPNEDAFKSLYYAAVESGLPDNSDVINVAGGVYNPESPISIVKSIRSIGDIAVPSNVVINAPLTAGLYDRECFQVWTSDVIIKGHKLVGAMDARPDDFPAWSQPGRQNQGVTIGTHWIGATIRGLHDIIVSYNEILDCSKGMFLYHTKNCEASYNNISTTEGKDPDNFYDVMGWGGDGIHVYLEVPSDYPTGNIITYNTMDNVRVGVFLNGDSIGGTAPSAWDFRNTLIERNVLTNLWNAGIVLQCASGTDGAPIIIRLNEIYTSTGRRDGDEGNERGLISIHGDHVEALQNILTGSEEHGIWADGHHLIIATNSLALCTKDGVIIAAYKKVEPNNGWTLPEISREDIVVELNAIRECRVGAKVCGGSNKDISIVRNSIEECLVAAVSFQEEIEDLKVIGNDIRNNPVGVACDVEGEKASDVRIHLNHFEGNAVAVKNDYQAEPQEIDARFNWWGSPDGPGGVGPGQGDAVTAHVLYEPFLTGCPVHGSCKVEVVEGDSPVVVNPDAGITLEGIDLTYASSGLLGSVKFDEEPVTSETFEHATGLKPIKFVDVFGTGLASGKVKVTVNVAKELNAGLSARSLRLYMWYGGAWHLGENAGVDVATKTVWGIFKALDLTGSPGGVGSESHTNWVNVIKNYVDTLETAMGKILFSMDFWSVPQEEVAITGTAGDKSLPSITIDDLPNGATIVRAIAFFKFRAIENHTYAGVNSLDGAQEIQVKPTAGAYIDAINFVTGQFTLAQDTREGGDVIIGAIDVSGSGKVEANGVYDFQWDEAIALEDGIKFNDVQVGLRIWYSV